MDDNLKKSVAQSIEKLAGKLEKLGGKELQFNPRDIFFGNMTYYLNPSATDVS